MSTKVPRPAAAWQQPSPTDSRYTQIPRALLAMLTPREYQLVAALLGYRWFDDSLIIPSVKRLAAEMGCSVRTVQRTAARLEAIGIIVIVPRFRGDLGQTSNEYRPGPILLAMLPRLGDSSAADSQPRRHPPVTTAAGERYSGNHNNRKGAGTGYERFDARNYYETSSGDLRVRG